MSKGARVTEWADPDPAVDGGHDEVREIAAWEAPIPGRSWAGIAIGSLLVLIALGWIAALAVAVGEAGTREPLRLAAWIGVGCGPLALLAILFLLLVRSGQSEANAFARAAARIRAESVDLARTLTVLDDRITGARALLDEHGAALAALGEESTKRLTTAGAALRDQAADFARVAVTLDNATSTARADLGVLLSDLPHAEELTGRLASLLREAGSGVESNTRSLGGLLGNLENQAKSADATSAGAAARLASQLDRIEASAAAADRRIGEAAGALGRTIDTAMAAAGDAIEDTRRGVNEQAEALTAMVEHGRASLDSA